MKQELRAAYDRERQAAATAFGIGDFDNAFRHLERAHILGQRSTGAHVGAHVAMLRVGWRRQDAREVFGQLTRIVAATLFTRLWVPLGNTGGANVSATKPMPLPEDLLDLMRDDGIV